MTFSRLALVASALILTAATESAAKELNPGVLAGAQRWSAELPLTELRLAPRGGFDHSVAFNGEIHLVVWKRFDEIVGARISRAGELLDAIPFLISDGGSPNDSARVIWNGERFLVVWRSSYQSVRARFLDREGRLSAVYAVRQGFESSGLFVATNGSTTLVTGRGGQGSFVRRDGSTAPVSLPRAQFQTVASVASDGTDYLVVLEGSATSLVRVDGNSGVATRTADLLRMLSPQLQPSREGYLLFSGYAPLTVTHISREGRVIGEPLLITNDIPLNVVVTSATLSDGSIVAVWQAPTRSSEPGPMMLARISGSEVKTPIVVGPLGTDAKLSGDPSAPLVVWYDRDSIRHARLDPVTGVLSGNSATSMGGADQRSPVVAATSAGWFTVWQEGLSLVKAALVSPILGRGPEFTVGESDGFSDSPTVAANERVVLVTWRIGNTIVARRFRPTGEALDPIPFVVSRKAASGLPEPAAVVWNGRYFLVASTAILPFTGSSTPRRIRLYRVTEEGVVLDPDGKEIAASMRSRAVQSLPAIASAGDVSLLVWQDGEVLGGCQITCPTPPPLARIEGIRISLEGEPIDPVQTVYSTSPAQVPVVAARGSEFLLAWRGGGNVVARVVSASDPASGVAREIAGASGQISSLGLAAAARTDGFFLVWNDGADVQGASLDRSGHPVEIMPIAVGHELPPLQRQPWLHLASRGNDLLVVYSRWSHPAGGAMRNFIRGFRAQRRRAIGR